MAEVLNGHAKGEKFSCIANDIINIKLVRKPSDIEDDDYTSFSPEYTHQIFGQDETILGYKDLKIDLYYTAGSLDIYLGKSYSEKADPEKFEEQIDNVSEIIAEKLEVQPMESLDQFRTKILENASFVPQGNLMHSYQVEGQEGSQQFVIYKVDVSMPGFRQYHQQLQTLLWWFIDAVSYIDIDDDRWTFYTLYEKFTVDGNTQYGLIGYSTVYRYYAYPNRKRPRISQMLILPPFQKKGHGTQMLETIYIDLRQDPDIMDITVEEPSEDFVRLRDYVDCKSCMHLPVFSPESLQHGFSTEMIQEAQDRLKINKRQARRVYEILRLQATSENNIEQFRLFRLDVKKRLYLPYQRQIKDLEKMKQFLRPEELETAMVDHGLDEKHEYLEGAFQETLEEYRRTLDRLATVSD